MAVRLAFLWLTVIFLVLISEGYGGPAKRVPVKRGTAAHPKQAKGIAHAPGAKKDLRLRPGAKTNQTKLPAGHPTKPKKPHPVPKNNPPAFPAGHHPNKPKPKPVPKTNKPKGLPTKPKKPQKPNPKLKSPVADSDSEKKVVVKKSLSRNNVKTVTVTKPANRGPHTPVKPQNQFAMHRAPPKKPPMKSHESKKPSLFMGRSFGTKGGKEVPVPKNKRVKRSPSSVLLQKKRNAEGAFEDDWQNGVPSGNIFRLGSMANYNPNLEARGDPSSPTTYVLDPAPGPYLTDSDSDEDVTTESPLTQRAAFKNWEQYLSAQRTKFSAGSGKTEIYKSSGYKPIMKPDEYFRYIDKLFKEKNDRVRAFHNLYMHMKEQNKKFKILEKPKNCGVYPC